MLWENISIINNKTIHTCNFDYERFEFKIYAESLSVSSQRAYRHMLIEYRILNIADLDFRENIIKLKRRFIFKFIKIR